MKYDIIGDIHGCAKTLEALLDRLDYTRVDGIYRHATKQAVFLGDFIDRGQYQQQVIDIVRPMIDSGSALSVMGNHEFNAIAYASLNKKGDNYLRPHSGKNRYQHQEFLATYEQDDAAYHELITWFRTLPLWLELDGINVVHACWDKQAIEQIKNNYDLSQRLTDAFLQQASIAGRWEYDAIETLLKGREIPLPEGYQFKDKDGNPRHHIRICWWDRAAKTYREVFFGPDDVISHLPDDKVPGDYSVLYERQAPPVFFGHYWMEGEVAPLAKNIACLDYSIAKVGGRLMAYRWEGEQTLLALIELSID